MVDATPPPAAPWAIVLGVTGNWAFAAATVLQALHRHSPNLKTDIYLFADAALPAGDKELLTKLGARVLPLDASTADLSERLNADALRVFSPLSLAKFHCFSLLDRYERVLWLDTDVLIQDDISGIFHYGPLALATEDPEFAEPAKVNPASINVHAPIPELADGKPNLNSGVIVFDCGLLGAEFMADRCAALVAKYGAQLRYPDQAIFNILVQQLERQGCPVELLPQKYNMHPRNPKATYAPIVHAFGAYKLWNDGLTATCFPEWQRDYARWVRMGGTPYTGPVDNASYLEGGAFHLLSGLHDTISKASEAIDSLQSRLHAATEVNARLESLLRKRG